MGADYSFNVKSMASYAPAFLGHNNSVLARVTLQFLQLCMYIKKTSVTFVNRAVLLKTFVLQPQPFFKIVRDLGILVGIRKMLCSCDCSLHSRRTRTRAHVPPIDQSFTRKCALTSDGISNFVPS